MNIYIYMYIYTGEKYDAKWDSIVEKTGMQMCMCLYKLCACVYI
jgi:hypothetical protein